MLVQMAISRTREYAADRMGAEIVGEPRYLASALARIENAAHQIPNEAAERNPATAHMFIINPLSGQRMDNLFSTHPATENRIAALEQLAAADGRAAAGPRRGRPRRHTHGSRPLGRRRAPRSLGLSATIVHEPSRCRFVRMPELIRRPSEFRAAARVAGADTSMTPARRIAPAEVPGLAARRIAADILDNVLRRHRPLDAELDGAEAHPGLAALADRDRALVRKLVATVLRRRRHAAPSAAAVPRLRLSQGCAARRNRAAGRRGADPVPRRARPCGGRSERAAGAGGPARRANIPA